MPNGTYGGVRGKGAQAKRSRSPTYSIGISSWVERVGHIKLADSLSLSRMTHLWVMMSSTKRSVTSMPLEPMAVRL